MAIANVTMNKVWEFIKKNSRQIILFHYKNPFYLGPRKENSAIIVFHRLKISDFFILKELLLEISK